MKSKCHKISNSTQKIANKWNSQKNDNKKSLSINEINKKYFWQFFEKNKLSNKNWPSLFINSIEN